MIRVIAILLIINSHIDSLIPIPYISTGGAIGNALFFVLSGYGLTLSLESNKMNYIQWIKKRLGKIYSTLIVFNLLIYIPLIVHFKNTLPPDLISILNIFLFPSAFVFIQAIILFYIISHPLIDKLSKRIVVFVELIVLLTYTLLFVFTIDKTAFTLFDYSNVSFQIIGWLSLFIFGIYLAKDKNALTQESNFLTVLLLIFNIVFIYLHRFLITKGLFVYTQIIQQFLLFTLVYLFFIVSKYYQTTDKFIGSIVQYISSITLELYLVHVTLLSFFNFSKYKFPIGLVVFIITTFVVSSTLKQIKNILFRTR